MRGVPFRLVLSLVLSCAGGTAIGEPLSFVDRLALDDAGPGGLTVVGDLIVLEERLVASGFDDVDGPVLIEFGRDGESGGLEIRSSIGDSGLSSLAADIAFGVGFDASFDASERFVFLPVSGTDAACRATGATRGCARFGIAGIALGEDGLSARTLVRTEASTFDVLLSADGTVLHGFEEARVSSYRVADDGRLTAFASLELPARIDTQTLSGDGRRILLLLDAGNDVSVVATVALDDAGGVSRTLATTPLSSEIGFPPGQHILAAPDADQLYVNVRVGDGSRDTRVARYAIDPAGRASLVDETDGEASETLPASTRFASSLVGTPNGRRLFTDGSAPGADLLDSQGHLHTYARASDGSLDWLGAERDGVDGVDGDDLLNVNDLGVSPDGRFLYVLANQVVDRPDTGRISRISWFAVDGEGVGRATAPATVVPAAPGTQMTPTDGAGGSSGGGCAVTTGGNGAPLWPVAVVAVWLRARRSRARAARGMVKDGANVHPDSPTGRVR